MQPDTPYPRDPPRHNMLTYIKETTTYAWNASERFRFWAKLLTCPCLCLCCSCDFLASDRRGWGARRRAEQQGRYMLMSEIDETRRVRRLVRRKRGLSVNGERGRWGRRKGAKEQVQSEFLNKLPLELRLQVYEMVLCEAEVVHMVPGVLEGGEYLKVRARQGCWIDISILRTCKKVYREAISTLYSGNTFSFAGYTTFIAFSHTIPRQHFAQLRHISIQTALESSHALWRKIGIQFPAPYSFPSFYALLSSLPSLREITLTYRIFEDGRWEASPTVQEFTLLEHFAADPGELGCKVYYELDEDLEKFGCCEGEDEKGRMLAFGRWPVGEKVQLQR